MPPFRMLESYGNYFTTKGISLVRKPVLENETEIPSRISSALKMSSPVKLFQTVMNQKWTKKLGT
jgi:hypothetical protein